jgi:site-specific recombinase XerD
MRVDRAHSEYIRWLLVTKNLSPHTIRAYNADVAAFESGIGRASLVSVIDDRVIIDFVESQRRAGLSVRSLRRRLAGVRGFCKWLVVSGRIEADPWPSTPITLGRPHSLPRFLPYEEIRRLARFLVREAGVDDPEDVRAVLRRPHECTTLLSVALMIATGLRVHELVSIDCRDIDLSGRTLRLLGKGQRERYVFLPNAWLTSLTSSYLQARKVMQLSEHQLLFNRKRQPLTTAVVRRRLARAGRAAGVSTHVTPHMLRHTAATQLIEAGVDIVYVSRLLGHASVNTTQIYTHVSDQALKRVISEADVLGGVVEAR